nr:hypothetical protein BaRGS_004695 [Batillaria attramentaria]
MFHQMASTLVVILICVGVTTALTAFFADCVATNLTFIPKFNGTVTGLKFDKNGLEGVETEDFFENVTELNSLSLSDNGMTNLCPNAFGLLHRLDTLYLDGNNLTYAGLAPAFAVRGLRTLTLLQANLVGPIPDDLFVKNPMPHLTKLWISMNTFESVNMTTMNEKITHIDARAFANPSLKVLHLDVNNVDFADSSVSEDAFLGCPHLSTLELEDNILETVSDYKFHRIFSPLTSLTTLYMGRTKTKHINASKVRAIRGVRDLLLFGNLIETIPDGTFDDMENLEKLDIDRNWITSISENTFSPAVRDRLVSLNISNNPFECTCSLLWFRSWVMSKKWLFDFDNAYSHYNCHNLPGKDLESFNMNEQMCLLSHAAYVFTVVVVGMFIFSMTSSILLYRYRWHIRLVMYEAFRGNPQARWRQRRPEEFQFDLFVSYSGEDILWVIHYLIPVLERQMGLRLCVHQRDFLLGNNITDNIVDSLAVSKRVLVLLSPGFARSQWCEFELQMCLRHVVENDDVMVIAILQNVPSRDLSPTMMALLKTTTYIQWAEEPEARASFWGRLRLALNDLLDEGES